MEFNARGATFQDGTGPTVLTQEVRPKEQALQGWSLTKGGHEVKTPELLGSCSPGTLWSELLWPMSLSHPGPPTGPDLPAT